MDKIVCVGKNYSDHVKEMGGKASELPVVFLKPPSVLRRAGANEQIQVALPRDEGEVHHEAEIVLELKADASNVTAAQASQLIARVTVGLDLTKRDVQAKQKAAGHPWTTSKVFRDSAIVGPLVSVSEFSNWLEIPFQFLLDGELRQEGKAGQMTYSPAECVAFISRLFPLCAGDSIFTGTPKGVGPLPSGSRSELQWDKIRYAVQWQ